MKYYRSTFTHSQHKENNMATKQFETVTEKFNKDITLKDDTYKALEEVRVLMGTDQTTGHVATPSDAVQHLIDLAHGV